MNYDKIILELLDRIKVLEEQVATLMEKEQAPKASPNKVSTGDIRNYIEECKSLAKSRGAKTLALVSGNVHRDLGLKSAMPMVCNAMRQCMELGDVILHTTPKGNSSTIEIQYNL